MDGVLGYTTLFAGNFAPKNWAFCNGQLLPIRSNTALFSLLGVAYGGDGKTTFALPDLRGRTVVGAGQSPGFSTYELGQTGGAITAFITAGQMPLHSHPIGMTITPYIGGTPNSASPANASYSTCNNNLYNYTENTELKSYTGSVTVAPAGQSLPVATLRPVIALNYIICLAGLFPQRG